MKENKTADVEIVKEKELRKATGGSLRDTSVMVQCKKCGKLVNLPVDSYFSNSSSYSGHHLCPGCGQDVYGSKIV